MATFNRRSSSSIFICRVPKILPSFIHAIEIPFHCRWNNIEREREEIHFKKEKNIYLTDDKSNLYARYDNFCCFLWRKRGEEKNNGHRSISRRKIRIENVERERERCIVKLARGSYLINRNKFGGAFNCNWWKRIIYTRTYVGTRRNYTRNDNTHDCKF